MRRPLALLLLVAVPACSEEPAERPVAVGAGASGGCKVTFYPPGGKAEEFHSSGPVHTNLYGDGFYFRDKHTGRQVELSGTVKVEQEP